MQSLSEKAKEFLDEVRELADRAGHPVSVLAATKTRSKEEIQTVIRAGVLLTGENKADEFRQKYPEGAYEGSDVHFIGTLQSNKAKYLVGKVGLIHSLCTLSAADAIEKCASRQDITQKVLIELHVGDEETKSGLPLSEAEDFSEALKAFPHIRVKGFMCVAPVGMDPKPYFLQVKELYDRLAPRYGFDTLSMGMSGDYREAIVCGSNLIRVGTALFGPRDYSTK